MASVRMTIELREQIIENYRKQCKTAFLSDYDVSPTIFKIVQDIQNKADEGGHFEALLQAAKDFETRLANHEKKYERVHTKNYNDTRGSISNVVEEYGTTRNFYPLKKLKQIHLVCNKNRPPAENYEPVVDWRGSYKSRWEDKVVPATASYVEGDMYFVHEFVEPVYFPYRTKGTADSYDNAEDYAPQVDVGLIITDSEMCAKLEKIPMAEQKVSDMVENFKEFVEPITTLKKFVDEFPGGKALVPAEKLQAMAAPAQKRQAKPKVSPEDLLTPTMKQEFNEVMLESSLLGDNND